MIFGSANLWVLIVRGLLCDLLGVTDMMHTSRCGCSTVVIHAGRIWGLTLLWIMELSGFFGYFSLQMGWDLGPDKHVCILLILKLF